MRNIVLTFTDSRSRVQAPLARLALTLLCLLLLTVPSLAQTATAPAPSKPATALAAGQQNNAAAQAPVINEFNVNGLKLIVKKRSSSQTVSVGLFFRGGTANTTAQNAGIEGLLLDTASEASTTFPREKVQAELSRNASAIAGTGGLDYSALVMGSTSAGFAKTWEIFTDVALHPKFDPVDFARLKDLRLASLREQSTTPDSYLSVLQAQVAYANHSYVNSPAGTIDSISRLTVADLKQYHTQMMQTSRMVLIVVGDVDPYELRNKVEASFGKLPRGDFKVGTAPALSFASPTVNVTSRTLPTNYIQAVYAAPGMDSPDYYPLLIATEILKTLVYQTVRVEKNLSYAPDAFLRTQGANVGGISVTAVDANQAVAIMLDQINLLRENILRDGPVKELINSYITKYYMFHETNGEQVGELADFELLGGGWRNSQVTFERLREVTAEDIQRVSEKYLKNLQFVVIGNPNSINKQIFIRQSAG